MQKYDVITAIIFLGLFSLILAGHNGTVTTILSSVVSMWIGYKVGKKS